MVMKQNRRMTTRPHSQKSEKIKFDDGNGLSCCLSMGNGYCKIYIVFRKHTPRKFLVVRKSIFFP